MTQFIGEFEIKEKLGHGGMGVVYRAHDPAMDRDVAIKILTSAGDADLLGRFRSEAATTAKLKHKNIVTVHTFGEHEGMPYLVMELLEGRDLGSLIRGKTPLSLLEKVHILHEVCEGLSYAHQNRVIHRDIKPGNIMLQSDGGVKILDFGIARVTGRDSTRRTQKGFMLGTISYMAPEQFRLGMDADELVDIFAFGDVCYELISAQHPFHAEDPGAVMFRITSVEPKPIRELAPNCPESVAAVIHQLLTKDRDLRYQNLRDVLFDIEPALFQLRHETATGIVAEAAALSAEGNTDAALARVKEALELDPVNREAGKLRSELQRKLQDRAVREKLIALQAEAEQLISQNKLAEAIPVLESAAQLDKTGTVQTRLESVRAELDRLKLATRLFGEARRDYQRGNLHESHRKVSAALEADPNHNEALRLAQTVRFELDARGRRMREALQVIAEHAAKGEFDEAFRLLDPAAREFGDHPEIAEARVHIQGLKAEFERKKRNQAFQDRLEHARAALEAGKLADAHVAIDAIHSEFADWPEGPQRVQELRQQLHQRERDAEVARVEKGLDELVRQQRFSEARSDLNRSLARYRGDPALTAALERVAQAEKTAKDIARAEDHIRRLRKQDLDKALAEAQSAATEHPRHEPFQEAVSAIAAELEARKRRETIAGALRLGKTLLESDPAHAADLLRAALKQVGREPELERLLASAESTAAERSEQRAVQTVLANVATLSASQQPGRALHELEAAIARYPRRPELKKAADDVRAELERIARAEKLRARIHAVEEALAARSWPRGRELVESARREFPEDRRLDELAGEIDRGQKTQDLAGLTTSVRQSLSRDDLDGARNHLTAAAGQYGSEAEWRLLNTELIQRQDYLKKLEEARGRVEQSQLEEAEDVLRRLLQNPARDARAGELLRSVGEKRASLEAEARERERREQEQRERERLEQERQETERRRRFEERRASIRGLLNGARFAEARSAIEKLATEFADFPESGEAVEALRRDLQDRERQADVGRIGSRADQLARQRRFPEACAELEAGLALYPGESTLRTALDQVKAAESHARAIGQSEENIQRLRQTNLAQAKTAAQKAVQQYPDHAPFQLALGSITDELQARQRRETIAEARQRAEPLLESEPAQAAEILRVALGQVGGDADLARLLASAEDAAAARAEQLAVDGILSSAQSQVAARQPAKALQELERGIAQYPQRQELIQAAYEARAELDRISREERLQAQVQAIEKTLAARDWRKAQTLIEVAAREFSGEARIGQLADDLERSRRAEELANLTSAVRHCLSRRDAEGASRKLASAAQFAETPEYQALLAEVRQLQSYQTALEVARNRLDESQLDEAERIVRDALQNPAKDKQAGDLLRAIEKKRASLAAEARKREQKETASREAARARESITAVASAASAPARAPQSSAAKVTPALVPELVREQMPAGPGVALYRRPAIVAPAALVVLVLGYFLFRPARGLVPVASLHPSPAAVSLTYDPSTGPEPSAEVDFGNLPGAYQASSRAPWVRLDPESGVKLSKLRVGMSSAGLAPGEYNADVQVTPGQGAGFAPVSIPVHLRIVANKVAPSPGPVTASGPTTLQVQPASLQFDYREGDPAPRSKPITVPADQVARIQFSIENQKDASWLHVQRAQLGFYVSVVPAGLGPGEHTATVRLDLAGAANSPQRVKVALNITTALGGIKLTSGLEQIRWQGTLKPGESLTIEGANASNGNLLAGELPGSAIQPDTSSLHGLAIQSLPSARNGFKLQLKNTGSEPVSDFTLYYRAVR